MSHKFNGTHGQNDDDDLGDECRRLFDELTKAENYFCDLAHVVADGEWVKIERGLLRFQFGVVARRAAECASALSGEDSMQRLALATMTVDNDKQGLRNILAKTIEAARSVMEWGEIQEVVTEAALKAKGAKVEVRMSLLIQGDVPRSLAAHAERVCG